MRLHRAIAGMCSTILAACGGPEGLEKTVPSDAERFAQADTCSETIYEWPVGTTDTQKTCAGPWQQQCCNMGSSVVSSCKHAHSAAPYKSPQYQTATSCHRVCTFSTVVCTSPTRCVKVCEEWGYDYCNFPECSINPATSPPAAAALSQVQAIRQDCRIDGNPPAPYVSAATSELTAVDSRTCWVTVENAPVGHVNGQPDPNGPRNVCDNLADSSKLCGWDQTKVTYALCPDPPTANVDGSPQVPVDPLKCGIADAMFSAPKLALSTVKQMGKKAPICLTCEDVPLGANPSDAQVQAKFQCLANRHADFVAGKLADAAAKDPDLDRKLIKNAELLFEFRGSQLSSTQVTTAEGLYTASPLVKPDCGQLPDWAPPSAGCGAAVDGKLVLCDRLSDAHVSPATALLEADRCVDAWNDVSALDPIACTGKSQYAAGWAGISTNQLRKAFSELRDTDFTTRRSRLQERMRLAGRWYGNLLAANEPTDQRWRDTSVVAGAIAQGAYSNQLGRLDAAPDVATRDAVMLDNGVADQELVQAALSNAVTTGQPPLRSAPLVFILANALRAASDRLNEIDFVHDLGCRFRLDCGVNLATRVSEMHSLFSTMADGTLLSKALLSAPDVPVGWQSAFQSVSAGHGVIEAAVLDALGLSPVAPYAPELVTNATVDQVPVFALGSIVNLSRMKADHYAQTGRFRPGETMALETSMLQSKLADVRSVAQKARDALAADHASYDANFQKLIDDQLAIVRGNNALSNATDAVAIKTELLRQLAQDLDGLRVAATVDLSRFGAAGVVYDDLVTKLEQSGPGFTEHWKSGPFEVPPTEAKFAGGSLPSNLTALAVTTLPPLAKWQWPIYAPAGTMVQVDTQGQWSATCAIGASANQFNPPFKNFAGAMTGPQGYGVTFTNGNYETRGQSGQDFTFWDGARALGSIASQVGSGIGSLAGSGKVDSTGGAVGTLMATAGTGAALGGPLGGLIGAGIGGAISVLGGLFGGDHDNHASGTEYRSSAAFNAGLHVSSAPFPAYPAGALLALKFKHLGQGSTDLYDVEVIQSPSTTIVATVDTDLFLAVNDRSCAPAVPVGALKISLELLEPRIASAVRVQSAMKTSSVEIQNRIQQMLTQGRVLSTDIESSRSLAMTALLANCGDCSGPAFAPFLQYYSNWVDIQLNQAERQIEIAKVERQLRVAAMDWEALVAQVAQLQRDSAILGLLPSWAAQNIDENRMKVDTDWLVRVVDRYVYPFMRAKYPETLRSNWGVPPGLATDPVFAKLTAGLDWTANWGAIADDTVKAFDAVQKKLDEADLAFKSQLTPFKVAISIPKPIGKVDPTVDLNVYAPGYASGSYTPPYRELDSASSAAIWAAIIAGEDSDPVVAARAPPIKIAIPAELLYNSIAPIGPKLDAQLYCGDVLPVISNIGLFVANDGGPQNDVWNAQPRGLPMHSSVHVNYIGSTGPEPFYGSNAAWLKFTIQPQYGLVKSAPIAFVPTGGGQGLSPAGEFVIDAGYSDWLDPLTPDANGVLGRRTLALVLVIEVERRTSGDFVSWVQQCK